MLYSLFSIIRFDELFQPPNPYQTPRSAFAFPSVFLFRVRQLKGGRNQVYVLCPLRRRSPSIWGSASRKPCASAPPLARNPNPRYKDQVSRSVLGGIVYLAPDRDLQSVFSRLCGHPIIWGPSYGTLRKRPQVIRRMAIWYRIPCSQALPITDWLPALWRAEKYWGYGAR